VNSVVSIQGRIAEIQVRIAALAAPRTPAVASTSRSSEAFASVLAAQAPEPVSNASPTESTSSVSATESVSSAPVSGTTTPRPTRVGSFGATQLANAAAIIEAGKAMGLSVRDQTIGVMTAIGESSLRVLDYGDNAGPDSRGLFQQRDNGAWGSLADRMDPTTSATSFFTALSRVHGRDSMTPTAVAHQVQRNADPQHYTRFWDDAVKIVSQLTGTTP
jgi:hypothetical protein